VAASKNAVKFGVDIYKVGLNLLVFTLTPIIPLTPIIRFYSDPNNYPGAESCKDRQLLTQQQVFEGEVAPRLKQKNERIEKN